MDPRKNSVLLSVSLAFAASLTTAGAETEPTERATVDFAQDIAPILQERCLECHDESMQMAGLRLDTRQAMEDGGVLVPGDADNSLLVQRLHDRQLGILMPPAGRMEEAAIEALGSWVNIGAPWPEETRLLNQMTAKSVRPESRAVFAAIRAGDQDALRTALSDRSLVNTRDQHGATPLMHASLYSGVETVQLLLDLGADPNLLDDHKMVALMYAAGGGPAKIRALLNRGAIVGKQSKLGRTTLLMASAFAGNSEVVKILLDAGEDVHFEDRRNWNALTLAARTGDATLVRTLLDAGADVNSGDSKRRSPGSPLMQAAWASDLELSRFLLNRGADADQQALDSGLIFAATHGNDELTELLLAFGADHRAKVVTNYVPETPILAAVYSDAMNTNIVRRLLRNGVDLNQADARGETASSIAAKRGNSEIARLLEVPAKTLQAEGSEPPKELVAPTPAAIRKLTQKSVSLLQSCGPIFFAKSGCTACHQQTASALVVRMAKNKGLAVDEITAHQQAKLTAVDLKRRRVAYLQRMKSGGTAHRLGYLLWGLSEGGYAADEVTDATFIELAGLQLANGSWVSDAHRPPTEYSPITATAVSLHAISLYSPPALRSSTARRVSRATEWLESASGFANAEKAFRLLGLHWGDADETLIAEATEDLLEDQASNGGWSQLPSLAADAYATGLTLFAIGQADPARVTSAAYHRGLSFLVQDAKEDGSWHVQSRSFKFQPYFESGFPHGDDQWISAAATGWATLALMQTLDDHPAGASAAQTAH